MPDTSVVRTRDVVGRILLFCMATLVLYVIAQRDYLLFHSFVELFSVVIACGIFMIAWNSRGFFDNNYLLFIGIAYLFVAFFDTLHMLAYHGMGVFKGYDDNNLPPQLWLVARYMESLALVVAPLYFRRWLPTGKILFLFVAVSAIAIWSIFFARNFPTCFVSGQGLTAFKRTSEYVIDLILVVALVLLYREKRRFEPKVLQLLTASIVCTIATELFFTVYIHLYGVSNFIGHIFKILSFGFMYKAIIETALKQPYGLLFRELKQSEEVLRQKEESLQLAQRLAQMGSWEWNMKTNSMWWSDEMYSLFDYEKEGTVACLERVVERVHGDDLDAVRQAIGTFLREKQPARVQHRIVRPDGTVRYMKAEVKLASSDESGTTPIAVGIVHDITEQVQAENMREDIERITRHDLKTPLNPIINIPEVLLMDSNLTEEQIELVQMIKSSGYRILSIIDASLTLYKMEQGTYVLEPDRCDLLPLIADIAKECDRQLQEKKLKLVCLLKGVPATANDAFMVVCEEMLCYTMLSNLIKNAIEASPADSLITVACDRDDTWNIISIHNRGAVPEGIRPRFFERYVTHGKSQGTGLGTYSALLAARAHKGDISMTTDEETGTLLTVRLPHDPGAGEVPAMSDRGVSAGR